MSGSFIGVIFLNIAFPATIGLFNCTHFSQPGNIPKTAGFPDFPLLAQ